MDVDTQSDAPPISIVVVTFAGRPYLDRCVRALADQARAARAELLLAFDEDLQSPEELEALAPGVTLIAMPGRRTFAELRAAGVERARGAIVAVTEDQCIPDPDWCSRLLEIHEQPYAAVGGAVEKGFPNGRETDGIVPWTIYLCDFSRYMNPVAEGPAGYLTDVNVSYKREKLHEIAEKWDGEFHETTVNWCLISRGETLYLSPDVIVRQQRGGRLGALLKERFDFGRLFASTRAAEVSGGKRLVFSVGSLVLPFVLTARVIGNVVGHRRHYGALLRAFPAVVLCNTFWALGETFGYVTGSAGQPLRPRDE